MDEPKPFFSGRFSPLLLQTPCKSQKDSLRHFHCLSKNLLRKKYDVPHSEQFSSDFRRDGRSLADARRGQQGEKRRKEPLWGDLCSSILCPCRAIFCKKFFIKLLDESCAICYYSILRGSARGIAFPLCKKHKKRLIYQGFSCDFCDLSIALKRCINKTIFRGKEENHADI